MQTFFKDVQTAMETDLLPRAGQVFADISQLQLNAQETAAGAGAGRCRGGTGARLWRPAQPAVQWHPVGKQAPKRSISSVDRAAARMAGCCSLQPLLLLCTDFSPHAAAHRLQLTRRGSWTRSWTASPGWWPPSRLRWRSSCRAWAPAEAGQQSLSAGATICTGALRLRAGGQALVGVFPPPTDFVHVVALCCALGCSAAST